MPRPDPNVKPEAKLNPTFLIGSLHDTRKHLDFCPYASTLTAYSIVLDCPVLTQIKCKRWGCRHCGPRRINSLALRTRDAKANRFITLTVNSNDYDTPRAAYDATRRSLSTLSRRIRSSYGTFEYLRILEVTKRGWPHYHLVARSEYIPQKWLSQAWCDLTGAFIVDVRKIDRRENVYFYVLKYLSKCKFIRWTNRRVSWSRYFFPPNSKPRGFQLGLEDRGYEAIHPSLAIQDLWPGREVIHFNKDVVILAEHYEQATAAAQDRKLADAIEQAEAREAASRQEGSFEGEKSSIPDDGASSDMAGISEGDSKDPAERLIFPDPGVGPYP